MSRPRGRQQGRDQAAGRPAPRVLMMHKYGRQAASFRYRLEQYVEFLEKAGARVDTSSLLGDDYLQARFKTGKRSWWPALKAAGGRLRTLARARDYDVVVVAIEVFPWLPSWFEGFLGILGVPYVFDYDDPIFHYYDSSPSRLVRWALGRKIHRVIQGAEVCFAGSPYLLEYALRANPRSIFLPTVVDLRRYSRTREITRKPGAPFTIGWIGSPSTSEYLHAIAGPLRDFCRAHPGARLVLVGSGPFGLEGVPIEVRPWKEESELDDILGFDVGLMPLSDDPWSRGKCAFKLIQYMACGVPSIASPVGANVRLLQGEGERPAGLFATTPDQWLEALQSIEGDPPLARRLSAEGRRRIEAEYCLQKTAPVFVGEVLRVAREKELIR